MCLINVVPKLKIVTVGVGTVLYFIVKLTWNLLVKFTLYFLVKLILYFLLEKALWRSSAFFKWRGHVHVLIQAAPILTLKLGALIGIEPRTTCTESQSISNSTQPLYISLHRKKHKNYMISLHSISSYEFHTHCLYQYTHMDVHNERTSNSVLQYTSYFSLAAFGDFAIIFFYNTYPILWQYIYIYTRCQGELFP